MMADPTDHQAGTRLAIIGFGKMGKFHARAFRRIAGVEIVAAVDSEPARGVEAARAGVPFFANIRDLPAGIDAAIVATPADSHAEIAVPLLEAGVDCLVEKPLALCPAEAERMMAAARSANAVLAVGQNERFNANVERALSFFGRNGGTISAIRCSQSAPAGGPDVVQDLMVHDLDWILGHEERGDCDVEIVDTRGLDGLLRHVCCRLAFGQRLYELTASHDGTGRERRITVTPRNGNALTADLTEPAASPENDPLVRQAQSFLDLRLGRASAISTGDQALRVLELTERIRSLCYETTPATVAAI